MMRPGGLHPRSDVDIPRGWFAQQSSDVHERRDGRRGFDDIPSGRRAVPRLNIGPLGNVT